MIKADPNTSKYSVANIGTDVNTTFCPHIQTRIHFFKESGEISQHLTSLHPAGQRLYIPSSSKYSPINIGLNSTNDQKAQTKNNILGTANNTSKYSPLNIGMNSNEMHRNIKFHNLKEGAIVQEHLKTVHHSNSLPYCDVLYPETSQRLGTLQLKRINSVVDIKPSQNNQFGKLQSSPIFTIYNTFYDFIFHFRSERT
jgi:hypothetical protein